MTGRPVAVIDCFGILDDAQIRRYFELGCEVKGLGRATSSGSRTRSATAGPDEAAASHKTTANKLKISRGPTRTHADGSFMAVDLAGIKPPACGAMFSPYPAHRSRSGPADAHAFAVRQTQTARSARSLCPGRSPGQKNLPSPESVCVRVGLWLKIHFVRQRRFRRSRMKACPPKRNRRQWFVWQGTKTGPPGGQKRKTAPERCRLVIEIKKRASTALRIKNQDATP